MHCPPLHGERDSQYKYPLPEQHAAWPQSSQKHSSGLCQFLLLCRHKQIGPESRSIYHQFCLSMWFSKFLLNRSQKNLRGWSLRLARLLAGQLPGLPDATPLIRNICNKGYRIQYSIPSSTKHLKTRRNGFLPSDYRAYKCWTSLSPSLSLLLFLGSILVKMVVKVGPVQTIQHWELIFISNTVHVYLYTYCIILQEGKWKTEVRSFRNQKNKSYKMRWSTLISPLCLFVGEKTTTTPFFSGGAFHRSN